jgi:hypothetical protein
MEDNAYHMVEAQNSDCTVFIRYIKLGLRCAPSGLSQRKRITGPQSAFSDPRTQLEVITGENHQRSNSHAVVSSASALTHRWHTRRAIHDIYDIRRSIFLSFSSSSSPFAWFLYPSGSARVGTSLLLCNRFQFRRHLFRDAPFTRCIAKPW